MLNISSDYSGAVSLVCESETQQPKKFILKPGQLAIIAHTQVQLESFGNQLIISWDYLSPALLFQAFHEFAENRNMVQNIEEIFHGLLIEGKHAQKFWFLDVERTITGVARNISQMLLPYVGQMQPIGGLCPSCQRQMFMYAIHCEICQQFYCIWCDIFSGHSHTMTFVSFY